jgi:hypothetical protein
MEIQRRMEIGSSQSFVIAQGFRRVGAHWGLTGHDGSPRLFAELSADPDRPEVRPVEAYQALLSSLQPGWAVRWLQICWPDPEPRKRFCGRLQDWHGRGGEVEGRELLRQGLWLFAQQAPLPFIRRTVLEFPSPGDEGLAWWEGLPGLMLAYGLQVTPLSLDAIQELARWIFNPTLA